MRDNDAVIAISIKQVISETDRAFLVQLDDLRQVWLPKSQIAEDSLDAMSPGDTDIDIEISAWIAEQKDIR